MSRRRLLVAGLVAVLAVAIAASTFESTLAPRAGGGANGTGSGGLFAANASFEPTGDAEPLPPALVVPLIVAASAVLGWYFVRHTREALAHLLRTLLVVGVVAIVLLAILQLLQLFVGQGPGQGGGFGGGFGGLPVGERGDGRVAPSPSVGVVVVLAAAAVAAVVGAYRATAGESPDPPADDADDVEEPVDPAAVARAAGRAADRIESADAPVDNEVYRAWRELTADLDVANPPASTPGEFAAAATDAGLDAEAVAELTDLFEAVRYGRAEPTAERETRALDALRRLERVHGGDGT